MGEVSAFSYCPGTSVFHRFDPRFKILCLVLLSLASLGTDFRSLGLMTLLLVWAGLKTRFALMSALKELRFFFILLFFVLIARMVSDEGPPLIQIQMITITQKGLVTGIMVCWRLLLIVWLGLLFVSTTRSSEIKSAVQWYLKPFPFIPAKKVAVMMGLVMRFIPVIFTQAHEIGVAQKARCIENRKNPIFRLKKYSMPLVRKTFERGDSLALAMEARCYNEDVVDTGLSFRPGDWAGLAGVLCLCLIMVL